MTDKEFFAYHPDILAVQQTNLGQPRKIMKNLSELQSMI